MSIKRICFISLITAAALIIFVAEAQIPPLISVPGVKLGLSNVMILVAMYLFRRKDALIVLALKVVLGNIFSGHLMSFFFSAAGGFLCFLIMALLYPLHSEKQIWALSAFGAIFHNIGQLLTAVLLLNEPMIFWYAPVLIISAVITGLFTGFCASLIVPRLRKLI